MLLATPAQAASYAHGGSGGGGGGGGAGGGTASSAGSSGVGASTLMKTLSVRLNRGTEFLRDTVQKAFVSSSSNGGSSLARAAINRVGGPFLSPASTSADAAFRGGKINSGGGRIATVVSSAIESGGISATKPISNEFSLSHVFANKLTTSSTSSLSSLTTMDSVQTVLNRRSNHLPPTLLHRNTSERLRSSSTDSLHHEMCHFKPIRPAATTPWKCSSRSRGGAIIKTPLANRSTHLMEVEQNCDDHKIKESINQSEGVTHQRLLSISSTIALPNASGIKWSQCSAFVLYNAGTVCSNNNNNNNNYRSQLPDRSVTSNSDDDNDDDDKRNPNKKQSATASAKKKIHRTRASGIDAKTRGRRKRVTTDATERRVTIKRAVAKLLVPTELDGSKGRSLRHNILSKTNCNDNPNTGTRRSSRDKTSIVSKRIQQEQLKQHNQEISAPITTRQRQNRGKRHAITLPDLKRNDEEPPSHKSLRQTGPTTSTTEAHHNMPSHAMLTRSRLKRQAQGSKL